MPVQPLCALEQQNAGAVSDICAHNTTYFIQRCYMQDCFTTSVWLFTGWQLAKPTGGSHP